MVTEEAYATLEAENATLRRDLVVVREELASAVQRIADLEAKKTPPPSFVKANRPAREPRSRRHRAPEQNHARWREEPTVRVTHPLAHCPDCGGRLGGAHVGRRRQVIDLPPSARVVVTEHQAQKGWCFACR
ncbi:MAG TPA: IS66 family transposase zinc-finger binding domain-containing protein [Ktedonobacterales bacterium]|nr:IS66 family transposase zinc-finger binding domain-containing protein [Ktedonobacterales bacterium]